MLKHGILGLLNIRNMTGYELMETFRDSLRYFWNAQTSQIYRELQTIEKNGWAVSESVSQVGKPDKKVYQITEAGKEELKDWLINGTLKSENSALLMKVFFMGEAGDDFAKAFFEAYQRGCIGTIQGLSQVPEMIEGYAAQLGVADKSIYWKMTVEFGRRYAEMARDWSQYCMALIDEKKAKEKE